MYRKSPVGVRSCSPVSWPKECVRRLEHEHERVGEGEGEGEGMGLSVGVEKRRPSCRDACQRDERDRGLAPVNAVQYVQYMVCRSGRGRRRRRGHW